MNQYRVIVPDKRLGPVGAIVQMEPDVATWYNRDRACTVLELIVEEARTIDAPPTDRMMRKRSRRGENS
jgi:hypothetical protein